MKTKTIIALLPVLVLTATACATHRPGGISSIQARTDADTPGIEYRVIVINGETYTATRSPYWPGSGEKWDMVLVPNPKASDGAPTR
jgi:hypothetical protein